MIALGIIRPSIRPYSIPIILVKKDGWWRFCMDYKALNKITILNKIPIPIIEKLLDVLTVSILKRMGSIWMQYWRDWKLMT
ncbi:hypothetical protein CR513_57837, partial [Mucuna pruriens]